MRRRQLAHRRRVERAAHVELVDDVVEPLLADGERSRRDHGAQGLRGEHGDRGSYPFAAAFQSMAALGSAARDAHLGRPDELAARARHAAGDRGARAARRRGARDRARLRADARAVRALRHRARGDRPPPRRPARRPRALGLASRSLALARWAQGRRFDVALGHGSNDVTVAAKLLGIPSATTFDYEWATVQHTVNCRLARRVVVPDAIPPERLAPLRRHARASCAATRASRRSTTSRTSSRTPPCSPSSASTPPRRSPSCARRPTSRSTTASRTRCSRSCSSACASRRRSWCCRARPSSAPSSRAAGGFVVPERAVDAQSLVAYADLVVSAGGTMNREAVALGTPVWTTFEGRLGAVDERLIAEGRLRRLDARRGRRGASSARGAPSGRRARAPRSGGASPTCWSTASLGLVARFAGRIAADAPADPLGGRLPVPSPQPAAGGAGRRTGRARLLPRVPAALRRRRPGALLAAVRAHDRVRRRRQRVRVRAVRPLPALDALRVPARLPADRAGGASSRRSRCVGLRRGRRSRGYEFTADALHVGQRARRRDRALRAADARVHRRRALRRARCSTSARCAASAPAATRARC